MPEVYDKKKALDFLYYLNQQPISWSAELLNLYSFLKFNETLKYYKEKDLRLSFLNEMITIDKELDDALL